jgi:hypothetical protein
MAQVTTSALSGMVTMQDTKEEVIGATVQAIHEPSGTKYAAVTNVNGRFTIQGMRSGGPYTVTVSYIGYETKTFKDITLQLAETYDLNVRLSENANELTEIVVSGKASKFAGDKMGASTNINSRTIQEIPTVSRSITDITKLSPYANGMSFAGANGRMTNFTLDGANMNNNFGLSSGLPGGGTPVSLDAIDEIQVVITPFDVRQTNFIGGGINAVTKSGTNTFKGTAYVYHTNENMRGNRVDNQELAARTEDRKTTYGFTLGGPIIKNKLFFFANFEKAIIPTTVTKWRGSEDGVADVNNSISRTKLTDLETISNFVRDRYGYDTGSWTDFPADESNIKYLARIDWNITDAHHLAVRFNHTSNVAWNAPSPTSNDFGKSWNYNTEGHFSQTSMGYANTFYKAEKNATTFSANLNSRFSQKFNNELLVTYSDVDDPIRDSNSAAFPWVQILSPNANGELRPYISLGYELFTWKNSVKNKTTTITDNATFYLGAHKVMAGLSFEHQYALNSYNRNGTGAYLYNSMDDFMNGAAPAAVALTWGYNGNDDPKDKVAFNQWGLYLQDEWNVNEKLKLTAGIRFDDLVFDNNDLMANSKIDELDFEGRRLTTGQWPKSRVQISPRIGFTWDVMGDKMLKVRGGTGLFAGRLPLVFFTNMPGNTGMSKYQFRSDRSDYTAAILEAFKGGLITDKNEMRDLIASIDPKAVTTKEPKDGTVPSTIAAVDPDFKMPQVWKSSIAVDYNVPIAFPLSLTGEFTYTKQLQDVMIENWDVKGDNSSWARMPGADNRIIYPSDYRINNRDTYVLTNTSKGYGWTANVTLNAEPVEKLHVMASYTHTVNKNISGLPGSNASSVVNAIYSVNGPRFATLQPSSFVIPDRIIGSITYSTKYDHYTLFYEGYRPTGYSYYYSNDVNGDGLTNDLMYIPRDDSEIKFATDDDRIAFWNYVEQDDYLKNHKGEYAEAYAAHPPFVHRFDFRWAHDFNLKVGNTFHKLQLSADFQNIGNLFSSRWGVEKNMGATANGGQILRLKNVADVKNGAAPIYVMNSNTDGTPITQTWDYSHTSGQCWRLQVGVKYFFN